ncbi:MAG: MotA/TolQ/ExbB proton channel family protein [Verrucomicrobiales bacterium]|nr:MotA/TolQ/ExbB proton channel family protein [Verrucomicrobiales bacterium]MCP5525971.1 MotA/TolQ/ExbB proton channel family protein [Verrucomicrobiales bacterium]
MWDFLLAGGPFMGLLVLTSIVSVTFIVERGLALRRSRVVPADLETLLAECRGRDDLPLVQSTCEKSPSTLSRLVATSVAHLGWPRNDNGNALQTRARQEVVSLERGLVVLEVVVGVAPLLGLLGTIHGLITLFGDIGQAGVSDNSVLARGIAIALNTTLMGLLIAIPSLVAWSYFTKKVETFAVEMENLLDDLLRRLYREPTPSGRRKGRSSGEGSEEPQGRRS